MIESARAPAAATAKLTAYAALAGIGLLAAVVLGEAAIVALAAPFALALAVGLLVPVPPLPEVSVSLDEHLVLEGGRATITLELHARAPLPRCEVTLSIPDGLKQDGPSRWSLGIAADDTVRLEVPVVAERYGRFVIGPVRTSVRGMFGLLSRSAVESDRIQLEVRPRAEALRTMVRALEVRARVGDRLARQPGDGIEFAEVRPYTPGSPGRINWRVTARHGQPYVNLRHPERSTDLIILVDTFSASTLARQVRAAAGLASAALARHDRVGLVAFGGVLHWVDPGLGQAQLERLVAALTATQWHHSYAWKSAETIPARTLPLRGLVVAISPMDDPRMLSALATIRARGVDLAVIETVGPIAPGPIPLARQIARRIIALERKEMREGFGRRGVPVVAWLDGEPLEAPLSALALWRRRARGRVAR